MCPENECVLVGSCCRISQYHVQSYSKHGPSYEATLRRSADAWREVASAFTR
eukprot:COSAG01_NODE_2235_length_8095_cov_5.886818_5_plen_52_part_00